MPQPSDPRIFVPTSLKFSIVKMTGCSRCCEPATHHIVASSTGGRDVVLSGNFCEQHAIAEQARHTEYWHSQAAVHAGLDQPQTR